MRILIQNINIVNPDGISKDMDIFIDNGIINEIGQGKPGKAERMIDGRGLYAFPGFIDLHCHLRDPGQTHKEDIATGTKSAAAGGFTTVCSMANTLPPICTPEQIAYIIKKAKAEGSARVLPIACVTMGLKGEELTDFYALKSAGAIAVSDDGLPLSADMAKKAMELAQKVDIPIMMHEEDLAYKKGGVVNAGENAEKANLPGVSREAENVMTARDLEISEQRGTAFHICHVSTKDSVDMIRKAKIRGVKVTCETAPHYFSLDDGMVLTGSPNAKMSPPLRTKEDVLAVIEGLVDGTIDAIATDHAPHTEEEKMRGMLEAPFGIIGLETAFALTITNLYNTGKLALTDIARLLSSSPAGILRIHGGYLKRGALADITICDIDRTYTYKKEDIVSKSKNSPFIGMKLCGRVKHTIVEGEIKYDRPAD